MVDISGDKLPVLGIVVTATRTSQGGNLEYTSSGGGGGGGASTIADGADVAQGAIADAAVAAGAAGTISAKLRRVTQTLADIATLLTNGIPVLGTGINVAASVDVNANVTADVDAAVAAAAGLRLMGWAVKERSGTTGAVFNIVHGATGAGGTVVKRYTLNGNESDTVWLGPGGIACANGISIDFISGNFDCELYHTTVA